MSNFDWSTPLLPIARKISAHTIAGGGWEKSMSAPSGYLFYMDFKYENKYEQKRKERRNKLTKIDRINKIKYIEEILKNN